MTRPDFDSPASIRDALLSLGITLKKRWGQNFLINRGVRERILSLLDAGNGDLIWEIGPGLGEMTEPLLLAGARVTAFEVDRGLCRYLTGVFGGCTGFSLVEGDFLKTWKARAVDGSPKGVLGNLPYSSASIMIASIVESDLRPSVLVFTVQKELGERMAARPGTKAYSAFSVLCQTAFGVTGRGIIKPGSFFPAPDVDSSIMEMRPLASGPGKAERSFLSALTRAFFASRRKTIRNNIPPNGFPHGCSRDLVLEAMAGEGIDPGRRAEELSPEDYIGLAAAVARLKGS